MGPDQTVATTPARRGRGQIRPSQWGQTNLPESTGPWGIPLFIGWGSRDEVLDPALQRELVSRLCASGENVRWAEYEGYGHGDVVRAGSPLIPDLLAWTDAVLAGSSAEVAQGC